MVYTVVIFAWRKAGSSPAAFKAHYESSHIPLLQTITGSLFPRTHTRHYIQRSASDPDTGNASASYTNTDHPATVLVGTQADFDYDAYAELVFDDEAAFQAFFGCVQRPEAAERIAEDEKLFLDRPKMTVAVLGESRVTRGSGGDGDGLAAEKDGQDRTG